jgi:NAD(P)-dependent dehydrogenase (short-subunit alcohol dehydrogenase family)
VIATASSAGAARDATVDNDDLDMTFDYDGLRAYKASKLANVLFTRELARAWAPGDTRPGQARSPTTRHSPSASGISPHPSAASGTDARAAAIS